MAYSICSARTCRDVVSRLGGHEDRRQEEGKEGHDNDCLRDANVFCYQPPSIILQRLGTVPGHIDVDVPREASGNMDFDGSGSLDGNILQDVEARPLRGFLGYLWWLPGTSGKHFWGLWGLRGTSSGIWATSWECIGGLLGGCLRCGDIRVYVPGSLSGNIAQDVDARRLGGFLGSVAWPPSSLLEALSEPLWASDHTLSAYGPHLRSLLERLRGSLTVSVSLGSLAASWVRLGECLGSSRCSYGLSWGAHEDVLGRLGAMSGASWAVRGGDAGGVSERLPGTSGSMFPESPLGTSCKAVLEPSWGALVTILALIFACPGRLGSL